MKMRKYPIIAFTLGTNNIVFAEFPDLIKIDLPAAIEIVANRLHFTENEKHYLIADVSKVREVAAEAKEFFQKQDGGLKNILAAALIASNPVSALIANIFIKTPKNFPSKFFWNKPDAVRWINEQRQKMNNAALTPASNLRS
jgi:hypothetical protein